MGFSPRIRRHWSTSQPGGHLINHVRWRYFNGRSRSIEGIGACDFQQLTGQEVLIFPDTPDIIGLLIRWSVPVRVGTPCRVEFEDSKGTDSSKTGPVIVGSKNELTVRWYTQGPLILPAADLTDKFACVHNRRRWQAHTPLIHVPRCPGGRS